MIFGDTDRVAIEFEMDENHGNEWMFGRFCYWLCGRRIGDYDLGTTLRDVLFCLETITGDAGWRSNEALMKLSKEDLAKLIFRTLYGDYDVDPAIEQRALDEQWARHIIDPDVDVFDGWQILLVENATAARCICFHYSTDTYLECWLDYGEFDKVLSAAMQPLRQIYEQTRK